MHQINILLQCFNYQDGISGILSTLSQKVINYALDAAGVGDYVEVDNFQLGNNVVGNIVSCDIHVHLWPIIKWIVENECPEILPLTDLIDEYILDNSSGLDLIISPQLQGIVEGLVNCNNFQFNNNGYFVFNSTQSSMLIHGICLSYANPMQVTLQNMNYTQNFMLNWAFEVNFKEDYALIYNGILLLFGVNSTHWNLGTYPNVNISRMAVPNSNVISLGWDTLPTINHPADMQFISGSMGNIISWNITDPDVSSPTYNVLRNGSLVITFPTMDFQSIH